MELVFDIEANGLLDTCSEIHCLVAINSETGELFEFASPDKYKSIEEGIELLSKADRLIGHNIIGFDLPVITKLYGVDLSRKMHLYDTVNAGRLAVPNLLDMDFRNKRLGMPRELYGRHKLEAWGHRLGDYKGDFHGPWDKWTQEMHDYCIQDVRLTRKLYHHLKSLPNGDPNKLCVQIEMGFQRVISEQERNGVPFDRDGALAIVNEATPKLNQTRETLVSQIPFLVKQKEFIPKRDNAKAGYKKGVPFIKDIKTKFNPNSRAHLMEFLKRKYGWIPTDFTGKGRPKVGRDQLEPLRDWEEVPAIIEYLDASKVLSYISGGKKSLLKFYKDGRVYGKVNTYGAVTSRCTHSDPNLAQAPSVRAYKGRECRALFKAPAGYKMVGADAKSLELRMLGHYLAYYDAGAYAREAVEGDVHTRNQLDAGLESRDDAKTFIYAFLYGAGELKLGDITEPKANHEVKRSVGKRLRDTFLTRNRAVAQLITAVESTYLTRKYLISLDGRHLYPREKHKALNTLLQGGGAVVMKAATWMMWDMGLYDLGAYQALNIHDENQIIVPEANAEDAGKIMVEAIRRTTDLLKLSVQMDGEYKIGNNWAETH